MTLWIAYNGWMGNGQVAVIVEAHSEEGAREFASAALRRAGGPEHDESYFEITEIESITLPYVCEIG